MTALEALAAVAPPIGIVCASGFEDRPALIAALAKRWRLLGNPADLIAHLKDPEAFAALCQAHGIPHPLTRATPPPDPAGWLVKRRGGAGGAHIHPAPGRRGGTIYYQRQVPGRAISALLLANGRAASLLGLSAQWPAPTTDKPFRYGGAVRPAAAACAASLADSVHRLAAAVGLRGLNSMDFMVHDDAFWLLEINPRPGATLDIFEPARGSLFALHVAACEGALPRRPPALTGAMAHGILYADRGVPSLPTIAWPAWTVDRPRAATCVGRGQPVCSVLARAATGASAKALLADRMAALRNTLETRTS
jgi:predicted ATP-grasp superfamily ATP-dependent carboligase